jgi:methylated-DNA-[protein]-cysteine S-methyltransferase
MTVVDGGYDACLATPFAVLGIRAGHDRVSGIDYLPRGAATLEPVNPMARRACREIERYLDDPHYRFSIPFALAGTDFQCAVWARISTIPVGKTDTYKGVAMAIGTSARAVGNACGANHVPILVPCHRVLASGGLGGFMKATRGFPLEIKRWLLRHEGVR